MAGKKAVTTEKYLTAEEPEIMVNQPQTRKITIQDSDLIQVQSNFMGNLIYKNRRSGEVTEWNYAGDVQLMTYGDLRAMRAEQIKFFKEQWVVILGVADGSESEATCAEIMKALSIAQYYKVLIKPTDFKSICGWSEKEIEDRVKSMTDGVKANLVVALNEHIKNGKLDSIKKIKAFENSLNCKLCTPEE